MAFDIYALDNLDDYDEQAFYAYHDKLLELFFEAPEGKALLQTWPGAGFWSHALLEYGMNYTGVTLTRMGAGHVNELLTEVFPRKISLGAPEDADHALPEMIAFWEYLRREYRLAKADEVLQCLREAQPAEFRRWMNDSSRFGMAKSFFVMGQQAGFDMTTEEGNAAFMQHYNENLARPGFVPGLPALSNLLAAGEALGLGPGSYVKKDAAKAKHKRKIARASRKKKQTEIASQARCLAFRRRGVPIAQPGWPVGQAHGVIHRRACLPAGQCARSVSFQPRQCGRSIVPQRY
jgi:hypothetical protein